MGRFDFQRVRGQPTRYWVYERGQVESTITRRIGIVHRGVSRRRWFAEADDGMLEETFTSRGKAGDALARHRVD